MKLFVAMLSLSLFVCVLRSPASSSLAAPDLSGVGGIVNHPSPSPSVSAPAATATPAPTETPAPTATPAPTPVRTSTPRPRCSTACQISGHVTNSSGQPIPNTRVNVYRAPENSIVGSGITDANGNYTFTVAAGTYKFFFNPPFTSLVAEWYADKSSITNANVVTVSGNTTVSASLASR